MNRHSGLVFFSLAALLLILISSTSEAARNADVITFTPADDGGRYLSVHQSATLQQWRFNAGAYFNYAYEPLEFADPTGRRRQGIVDDLLVTDIGAAIGFTDWWQMGFNMPIAIWQTFYNPNTLATAVRKETFYGKLGDLRVDMKFRLLDIDRYRVGLAIVPFMYMPTGKSEYFLGNDMWSPGGTLVFDADIRNRVFLALNATYRNYRNVRYDTNNVDAVLDDTIGFGGGINVRITDSWGVLAEATSESVINALFKNQLQNQAEFNAGVRWTPQKHVRGMAFTAGGGRGITTGIGSPDFRALLGVNYRRPAEVALPPPVEVEAVVEEKIIITQKIHFEFDRAVIRPISYPILDDVASLLAMNPQIRRVRVEGHTDWIGSDAYNQKLSERRANAVRDFLIAKGIEPDRLEAIGYGEAKPIADNNTSKGRARNRRTEFTVVQ